VVVDKMQVVMVRMVDQVVVWVSMVLLVDQETLLL
jgi:hypothetical protein